MFLCKSESHNCSLVLYEIICLLKSFIGLSTFTIDVVFQLNCIDGN